MSIHQLPQSRPAMSTFDNHPIDLNTLEQMLSFARSDTDRTEWVTVLMAIKSEFGEAGKQAAREWSATAPNFKAADFNSTWKSIRTGGGITIATLVKLAIDNGFAFQPISASEQARLKRMQRQRRREQAKANEAEAQTRAIQYQKAAQQAQRLWGKAAPAPAFHPYLQRKQVQPWGTRGISTPGHADALVIPVVGTKPPFTGQVQSLQFIQPDGQKRFLSGGKKAGGYYPIQWLDDAPVVICEGFATGATLAEHYRPDHSVICAFDSGNLEAVARYFRRQCPTTPMIVAGDNDHQTERQRGHNPGVHKAEKAALVVDAYLSIPAFGEDEAGTDWNDRWHLDQQRLEAMETEALYNEFGGLGE
ncbi:MAG: PriCT-2 domain-containing protein [Hydrogenovibrio sp.]|uniref:PriCT-2 domain-containing protein n=1 Tax=Hydrogenovibrio sp. TaxID=2065821 RepID=UPI0028700F28|nr:PriCT-2 domain-containing protein [Hydrogenovibrio sp.]MDR9499735.1 PriCT-2 domain-containing protein [Hydrogenovibrio sp.]